MLNNKGFDKWAGEYDESIPALSLGYPFEGYYDVLEFIQRQIENTNVTTNILDIGVGTGLLTNELYCKGHKITGIDFSQKMIEKAKIKMPNAKFYHFDFSNGLPNQLNDSRFDFIVSSYAIHHLNSNQKLIFIKQLFKKLNSNGKILIGDIAFPSRNEMELCKKEFSDRWDNEEIYLVVDELITELNGTGHKATFYQISKCAGVMVL